MGSSTTRAVLVLLVTFAAGVAAGVAADRLWLDAPTAEATRAGDRRGDAAREGREDRKHDEDRPRTTIERFADDLELTSRQRSRIEEILSRHREEMHEMWSELRPRFRRLMDSARADIEAVLTEEQTEQYRRLLRRERGDDDRWKEDRDEGGRDSDVPDGASGPGDREGEPHGGDRLDGVLDR